jgi:hypothetical protein
MTFVEAMQILSAFERHGVAYWIDILARLGEAFRYADLECEVLRVEGVTVRVATPRTLYRMKKDTVRPQDRLDAEVLKERDPANIELACDLSAIAARLAPQGATPGVYRYRSIAAASEQREAWEGSRRPRRASGESVSPPGSG